MTSINGETQLIGFFGATYRSSKMYAMYNAAFEALGLNYVYVPLVVKDLEKAVEGVRHLGIKAIGVTQALIHICRCRRTTMCSSPLSPAH